MNIKKNTLLSSAVAKMTLKTPPTSFGFHDSILCPTLQYKMFLLLFVSYK